MNTDVPLNILLSKESAYTNNNIETKEEYLRLFKGAVCKIHYFNLKGSKSELTSTT